MVNVLYLNVVFSFLFFVLSSVCIIVLLMMNKDHIKSLYNKLNIKSQDN